MKRSLTTIFLMTSLAAWPLLGQSSRVEPRSLMLPGIGSWSFNVYLPPGYDMSGERYPVLYLFRGAADEWLDRNEDASRRNRNIQDIADTLLAQGETGGIILVMPGFSALTGPATEADYGFILNTLIPYIDRNFRTLPSRWQRGLDGFSLGGLHMVNLIWRNPERFISAGSYDGTFSLFDFNQMILAGEEYFRRLAPYQFLLHSAAVPPSNLSYNRSFEELLMRHGIHNDFSDIVLSPTSQHNWFNADEHMVLSLPMHWSKFQAPLCTVPIHWTSSIAARCAGTVRLTWGIGQAPESLKTLLEYSRNSGGSWKTLLFSSASDSVFDWNTLADADGTRYMLRLRVFGETSCGIIESDRQLTVDNPGNAPPDVVFLAPRKGEQVSGAYRILWKAEDPEGDAVTVSIFGSSDRGTAWTPIVGNLPNTGTYTWNSQDAPNATSYLLKLRCSDGILATEVISPAIQLLNSRSTVGTVRHSQGRSDGRVIPNIVDPLQLTGHTYRITFDDTIPCRKVYSIFDVTRNTYALKKVEFRGDGTEGPLFDGVRLSVFDPSDVRNNIDSTRWSKGGSTLSFEVSLPTVYSGNDTVKGVAYPADYEMRIADRIVDTSSGFLGAVPTPLYFTVWNTTENHRCDVVFGELDGDGRISRFDEVYILEKDPTGTPLLTWKVFFTGGATVTPPLPGDVFRLKSIKPLGSDDVFEFTSIAAAVRSIADDLPHAVELLQNFPNPFNPTTTICYVLATDGLATLKVFDVLGREIATLAEGFQTQGSHFVRWDGSGASGGAYFYRLKVGNNVIVKRALLLK